VPDSRIRLLPIALSAAQVRDYYRGFANATMWPLLHDAIEKVPLRACLVAYPGGRSVGSRTNRPLTQAIGRPVAPSTSFRSPSGSLSLMFCASMRAAVACGQD